jgi:hypothetical protein
MIWAMVSIPILDKMKDKRHGMVIQHPETGKRHLVTAYSFVFDADLLQSINDPSSPTVEAQANLHKWVDGPDCTGGDVSRGKEIVTP